MKQQVDSETLQRFRQDVAAAAGVAVAATRVFSDDYLSAVLLVPGREQRYAADKMAKCLTWRISYGVDTLRVDAVRAHLSNGSMYWLGYDWQRRPILWVRPRLKDWAAMPQTRDNEIRAHVYLLELAFREFLPPRESAVTVVADAAGLGTRETDVWLMQGLASTCVANYPDRIAKLCVGPVNSAVKTISSLVMPLLPPRLRDKIEFLSDPAKDLPRLVPEELIPDYMGGRAVHDLRGDAATDVALDVDVMIQQQKQRLAELVAQETR
ncbi:hypothetical protein PINS_up002326 [Pythium insidiosum]|nr:hypothetical protein PINS_up002326 [Pythium insidiosum]